MKLDGQRIIVTGATGGLGPHLVEAFLAVGARVIATARRRTRLDALRADLHQHERLEVAECDVADPAGIEALLDAVERGGGIDGVVHAAGHFKYGELKDYDDGDVAQVLTSNVHSTAWLVRGAVRRMLARGRGSITCLSAEGSLVPSAQFSVYGAAKAFVTHLTQAVALETHGTGVRINAILPGVIDTPANRKAMPDADPSGWTSPRAIARTAVWLAGTDADGVSGALLRLPGS